MVNSTPPPSRASSPSATDESEEPDWLLPLEGAASGATVAFEAWGLRMDQEEYQAGLRNFRRSNASATEQDYQAHLNERLLVLAWLEQSRLRRDRAFQAEIRAGLREDLADRVVSRLLVNEVAPVTEAELLTLYDRRRSQFHSPEMTRIRMIQVATREEADRVLASLRAGASFGEVAAANSLHDSQLRGGELDPFPRGTFAVLELEELAFSLSPGEIDSAETVAGTFIVEKLSHVSAHVIPFEDVREELRAELEGERVRAARERLMAQFRNQVLAR